MAQLRDYQQRVIGEINDAWSRGSRAPCAVMPTGAGKSVVLRHIVAQHTGASVTMAHRQELVSQLSVHLATEGVYHSLIAPTNVIANITKIHREELGKPFVKPGARAVVASVDTLIARTEKLRSWGQQVSLWICDESAHLLQDNKWGKAVTMFPNARGLGVTATPQRADGKGLGAHADGVFDSIIIGPTLRELIDRKFLSEYEIVIPESDFDRSSLTITPTGDFSRSKMREAAKRSHLVGDVVEQYCKWSFGQLGVVFATDVETSDEIAQRFRDSGIPAASISADTPDIERYHLMQQFKRREIWVVVNVDLFDEGVDIPAIDVVVMARPTKSLAKYLQMIGRGLRMYDGKVRCLVIDHVSNIREHGLPDKPRYWTLDGREKRSRPRDPDEIPITTCTQCFKQYARTHAACPYCGHAPEPVGGRRSIESVDGDLTLLDADILARMRSEIELEPPNRVAHRVAMAAGEIAGKGAANKQQERIDAQHQLAETIALWAGHGRARGESDSELYRRFYFLTGIDVLGALGQSRSDMEKLIDRVKEFLP